MFDESGLAAPRSSITRRNLLHAGGALGALSAVSGLLGPAITFAQAAPPRGIGAEGRRTLIRGGAVMSMDGTVGDFAKGDVLIEGRTIRQVGVDIAAGDAAVVDATGMIVMPGFIDTHHHLFETAMRSLLADATLSADPASPQAMNYYDIVQRQFAPHYRPRDVYLTELFGSLSALDAGVTTGLDISQIHLSPQHSDAAVAGLLASGRRAVMVHSGDAQGGTSDIRRVQGRHFSSTDQLLTLAIGSEISSPTWESLWNLGRQMKLPIASHVVGALGNRPLFDKLAAAGKFGPDNIFIHMTGMSDLAWRAVQQSGAAVSMAVPIEMSMRHGMPPIMKALEFGIEPSLSTDVDVTMTADFFTQMRSVLTLQRAFANDAVLEKQPRPPALLKARDALRFATMNGAKALHLDSKVGSLTPGKEADIILLDAGAINVAPLNYVPGAVVNLMDRSNVDTVFVAGSVRKWRRRLLNVDLPKLRTEVEASRDRLFAAAAVQQDLFRP